MPKSTDLRHYQQDAIDKIAYWMHTGIIPCENNELCIKKGLKMREHSKNILDEILKSVNLMDLVGPENNNDGLVIYRDKYKNVYDLAEKVKYCIHEPIISNIMWMQSPIGSGKTLMALKTIKSLPTCKIQDNRYAYLNKPYRDFISCSFFISKLYDPLTEHGEENTFVLPSLDSIANHKKIWYLNPDSKHYRKKYVNSTIIIVPSKQVGMHWMNEIEKHNLGLSCEYIITYASASQMDKDINNNNAKNIYIFCSIKPGSNKIVSHDTLTCVCKTYKFKYAIIDEIQDMIYKNDNYDSRFVDRYHPPRSDEIRHKLEVDHMLVISATDITKLSNSNQIITPHLLLFGVGSMIQCKMAVEQALVDEDIQLPAINYIYKLCRNLDTFKKLVEALVTPEILELIDNGHISNVAEQMNLKKANTPNELIRSFVHRDEQKLQKQIDTYNKLNTLIQNDEEVKLLSEDTIKCYKAERVALVPIIETIRGKIKRFTDQLELFGKETCAICMEDEMTDPVLLPCTHTGCASCIMHACKKYGNCPICRTKFTWSQIGIVTETPELPAVVAVPEPTLPRNETLTNIINKISETDHSCKIVIYCMNPSICDLIANSAARLNINVSVLRNSNLNVLKHFVDSDAREILITCYKAVPSGIDLSCTTDLIINFDNKELTQYYLKQVIGRCHRYPRTTALNLYQIHSSLDEKIAKVM